MTIEGTKSTEMESLRAAYALSSSVIPVISVVKFF